MEIDHEIISKVIFLLSTDSFTNWQLQSKVCSQITGLPGAQAFPGKCVIGWTECPPMTIAVNWDIKLQNKQNFLAV